ncbi:uncharacterized [Tachysurus ichikawai]
MRGVQWAPAPSLPCLSSQAVSRTPAYGFQTERTALRYGPPAAVTLTGCSAESSPSELDMRYAGRVNQLTAAVPQKEYAGILMLMADLTSSLSPVSELTTQLDLL